MFLQLLSIALGDDPEPGDEGEDEKEVSKATLGYVVFMILTAIVVITVVFEKLKEMMFELADSSTKPIFLALFGEMTVLGFIGLVLFILGQAGLVETISEQILGEKEALQEEVELIHMGLFLVMVLFIMQCLALTYNTTRQHNLWREFEHAVDDDFDEDDVEDDLRWNYSCGLKAFIAIKERFVTSLDSSELVRWKSDMVAAYQNRQHNGYSTLRRFFGNVVDLEEWCEAMARQVWNTTHPKFTLYDRKANFTTFEIPRARFNEYKSPRSNSKGGKSWFNVQSTMNLQRTSMMGSSPRRGPRTPRGRVHLQTRKIKSKNDGENKRYKQIENDKLRIVEAHFSADSERDQEEWREFCTEQERKLQYLMVGSRFNFASYLGHSMGHTVVELVEIPPATWLAVEVIFIMTSVAIIIQENVPILFPLLGFGGVLAGVAFWLMRRLQHLQLLLTPPHGRPDAIDDGDDEEAGEYQQIPRLYRQHATDEGRYGPSWKPDVRPALLFGSQEKTEAVYMFTYRFLSLMHSMYGAIVLLMAAYSPMQVNLLHPGEEGSDVSNAFGCILGVGLALVPSIAIRSMVSELMRLLIVTSFVEEGRVSRLVRKTVRHMHTNQALMTLILINKLKKRKDTQDSRDVPRPVDTSHVHELGDVNSLLSQLAMLSHSIWAKKRIEKGWRYGKVKNGEKKIHPDLIHYDQLPQGSKDWNIGDARELLKVIACLGYSVVPVTEVTQREAFREGIIEEMPVMSRPTSRRRPSIQDSLLLSKRRGSKINMDRAESAMKAESKARIALLDNSDDEEEGDSVGGLLSLGMTMAEDPDAKVPPSRKLKEVRIGSAIYSMTMIERISDMRLPSILRELAEMIAANAHQRWCHAQYKKGWTFGNEYSDEKKTHPDLIRFECLDDEHQDNDKEGIRMMIRGILDFDFTFIERKISHSKLARLRIKSGSIKDQKSRTDIRGVFEIYAQDLGMGQHAMHCTDVKRALEDFGLPFKSPTEILQIIQDMDPTNTGSVTLQNFERWIMAEEKACGAGDKLDVSAVADAIFNQMDEDGSGTISISELMQQLLQWSGSANFNYEDALDVIKDFSRDDSGELDEHDFYQLLVKITVAEMPKADYKL